MKKLPKVLATVSFLAPMGVAALGVGDIELHSALNQPLNANIALVSSRSESSSDIKISLASPDAFKRAGIERYFYLSNIRFKPVVALDGTLSVKVTSHDIIREPFLNFLVEVNWPQGRALKEFTVLLDPPVTLREAEPVIQRSPLARRAVVESPSIRAAGKVPSSSVSAGQAVTGSAGSEFGPTQKNDTLWSIATQVNSDPSVSQEQMMMSLYRKNPQAFYKKNVNALKRGETLKIPTREEAMQLSKGEARRQFSDQYKVWTAKVPVIKLNTPEQKKVSSTEPLSAKVQETEPQLTLLTPTDKKTADSIGLSEQDSGAGGNAESRVDMAIEMSETVRQENENIQKRMAALEEQISTMQRLLVLKDEQLATLQGSQAADVIDIEDESITETVDVEAEPSKDIAIETAEPEQSAVIPPSLPESPFYEDPIYLAAGGLGLLVLGFIAISVRRKRAIEEVTMAESILVAPDEPSNSNDELIAPVVDSSESEAGIPAESSFLSEFTPSDFDTLESDNDEVDPITEADVYLAYGRYQQAEDLVRQAIENDPENEEYKLKLLEIHFATEDKSAFLSLAKEIHSDCAESSPEIWVRAVEMGQDMCPEEPLFQGNDDIEEGVAEEEGEIALDEASAALDGEQQIVEEAELSSQEEEVESLEFDVNEDVSLNDLSNVESKEEVVSSVDEDESNLIDFGSVEPLEASGEEVAGITEPPVDEETEVAPAEEENDDFSFDFEMVTPDEAPSEEPVSVQNEGEQDGEFELDLDSDDIASSLTDMDEVETKLDLAKAYVDMEDELSAKGILQEVIEQGNDEQKAEAQALMDGLEG